MRITFVLAILLFAAVPARAALVFQSGDTPVHFLELYTSEGCSSCPPADAWFTGLKSDASLWKTLVPVAWHVDDWDRIGWKDVFGSRNYSIRQKSAASQIGTTTYTPEIFLNGAEWKGFSDGQPLPPPDRGEVGNLRVTQTAPREFIVEFISKGDFGRRLDVYGALLGMDLSVTPTAGENRGKDLVHDFVVLGISMKTLEAHNGTYTVRMTLPNYCTADPEKKAAAFWVAPTGGFKAIQATGGFLPEEIPDEP